MPGQMKIENESDQITVDLFVLGGGPGGYFAAGLAGQEGLNVVLAEKNKIGGVCLNEGCIPSKSLLHSAKICSHSKDALEYGITGAPLVLDQKAVIKRKNKIVNTLVQGVKMQMRQGHVTVLEDEARVVGRANGRIHLSVSDQLYTTTNLIIATGSIPIIPPIQGIDDGIAKGYLLTNREALDLQVIPQRLVVIGGGAIGLEMASYYHSAGSDVIVIEMLDHIGGAIDRTIAALLQRSLEEKGIQFALGAKAMEIHEDRVIYEQNGETFTTQSDFVLLSVGRRPSIENNGFETIQLYTDKGRIVTDRQCRTNIPGVYAIGDVNGRCMLAHVAYREAHVAVNTILSRRDTMRYDAVPSVIYTQPEVASVGMTEEEAKLKGIAYKKISIPLQYSGRFMAETAGESSLCQMLFSADQKYLIGCHLLGPYTSEFITIASVFIEKEMTVDEMKEIIFPHPTVSEVLREAIFQLRAIN